MLKIREAEKLHEANSYRNQAFGLSVKRKVIVVSDFCDTENDSKKCNNCFLLALPSQKATSILQFQGLKDL